MSGMTGGARSNSGIIGPKTFTDTPSFWATGDTDVLNITASSYVTVPLNVELFDNGSNYDTGTYTFTAPVTGVYHFAAHLKLLDASLGHVFVNFYITLTSRQMRAQFDFSSLGSGPEHFGIYDVVFDTEMAKGDTATTRVYHVTAGAGTDIAADDSWFSGHLIR